MRKGSAGSARGIVRVIDELVAVLARAGATGATGAMTVRAAPGSWSGKLIGRLDSNGIAWSITVAHQKRVLEEIAAIPSQSGVDIDDTVGGQAQVAETIYTTGTGRRQRHVRLVVRRTRLTEWAQRKLGRTCGITPSSPTPISTFDADEFHRAHATVELAMRDPRDGGLEHVPSGHFHALIGLWISASAALAPSSPSSR